MLPASGLVPAVSLRAGGLELLSVPYRKLEELNAWFGCEGVTTPTH